MGSISLTVINVFYYLISLANITRYLKHYRLIPSPAQHGKSLCLTSQVHLTKNQLALTMLLPQQGGRNRINYLSIWEL